VCNYLASTAYVLSALAKVREDLEESFVDRAIRFVLSRQNADGGWGESTESYTDPKKAGKGPSTVPLTSLILGALVELGRGQDPAVEKGVRYLLRKQRSDGTWPNDDYVATNIPPLGFYFYGGAVRHMPLEALARDARRHEQQAIVPAETHGRWTSAISRRAHAHRSDGRRRRRRDLRGRTSRR
jgi:squalene-hopene/tetraprenyl-beta-curcumene cyclase